MCFLILSVSIILHIIAMEADKIHPVKLQTHRKVGEEKSKAFASAEAKKCALPQTHAHPESQNVTLAGKMSVEV